MLFPLVCERAGSFARFAHKAKQVPQESHFKILCQNYIILILKFSYNIEGEKFISFFSF